MKIEIKYDKKADSVYLSFSNQKAAYSKRLDSKRSVDYSEDGEIRGIRFLSAGSGLKTTDLPYRRAIDDALYDNGIAGIVYEHGANRGTEDFRNGDDAVETLWKMPLKYRMAALMRTIAVILFFTGSIAVAILMTRNMFVLTSVPSLLASLCGLIAALFPTVIGSFILFVSLDVRSQTSRLQNIRR